MRESPYLIDFTSLILVNSVGFGEGCYEGRSIWAELSGRQWPFVALLIASLVHDIHVLYCTKKCFSWFNLIKSDWLSNWRDSILLTHYFIYALFIHPILLCVVASRAISKQVNMASPADVVIDATNVLSKFSHIVAGSSSNFLSYHTIICLLTHSLDEADFGGYVGPAGSLILIGIFILTLAPPLASKDQN